MEGDRLMLKMMKTWPAEPPEAGDIDVHFGDNRVITGMPRNELEAKLMERKVSAVEFLTWKNLPVTDANVVLVAYTALQAVKQWPPVPSPAPSSSKLPPKKRPLPTEQTDDDDEVGVTPYL